jgi:hypothetical protein
MKSPRCNLTYQGLFNHIKNRPQFPCNFKFEFHWNFSEKIIIQKFNSSLHCRLNIMKSPSLCTSSHWGLDNGNKGEVKGAMVWGIRNVTIWKKQIAFPLIYSFPLNEHPCVRDGLFGSDWIIVHNFKSHVEEATSNIYMYTIIIIIIIIYERNPQPFEGSIFLIKIPIQGCLLRSLDWKKSCSMCDLYEHLLPINGNTLNCRNNKHELAMATQVAMFYFWRFRRVVGENKFRQHIWTRARCIHQSPSPKRQERPRGWREVLFKHLFL